MFKKYYMVYYADLFDTLLGMPYLSKEEISEYLYTNKREKLHLHIILFLIKSTKKELVCNAEKVLDKKRENGNKCEIVEILKCPRGLVSDFVDKGYKVYDF